jgi:ferredoxin-type protein NapH
VTKNAEGSTLSARTPNSAFDAASDTGQRRRFFWQRHLNKLRWLTLTVVFVSLIILPVISVYQNFLAAHAYDLLAPADKALYDVVDAAVTPFIDNPEEDLDAIKGTTWSANFWGYQISDPLAAAGQSAASVSLYWPMLASALLPVLVTVLFGRIFCGWICPATLLYELNTNLTLLLERAGAKVGKRRFDRRIKYAVLGLGLLLSMATGAVLFALIYPPAIIGRELYYVIALGSFGSGAVFFVFTLLFDLLVARRGFCRYLCPGGALYSLLGRFRLLRIQRRVQPCNDCARCNAVCEFGLDPMRDGFGQECNNCTACIAACPVDALVLGWQRKDQAEQGPGHQSRSYRHHKDVIASTQVGCDTTS